MPLQICTDCEYLSPPTTAFRRQQGDAGSGARQGQLSPSGELNGWRRPRRNGAVARGAPQRMQLDSEIVVLPANQPPPPRLQAASSSCLITPLATSHISRSHLLYSRLHHIFELFYTAVANFYKACHMRGYITHVCCYKAILYHASQVLFNMLHSSFISHLCYAMKCVT